jgi:hypothetical protein
MVTGASTILGPPAREAKAAPSVSQPISAAQTRGEFWREFLRVQCDKLILLCLIGFLWRIGQFEMMKYAVGGLIVSINHNRFRWS